MPDQYLLSPPESLRERAAQLVMPRLGSNMPPPVSVETDAKRALALAERCPVGGFVLFNGAGEDSTREVLAALQRRARYPLLIGTDMERGLGQQVQGATVFPHALAFAALEKKAAEAAVEAFARASAREALRTGIHLAFAPVADVHRDPRNPIIATRAFGREPSTVGRLVRAYVEGARAEGLLTTAKHFPGHGGTHQDSHAEVPLVDDAREVLEQTDLVPFREAVAAGVDLVMPGHLQVPALDASGQIATFSAPMLSGVLRDELGFRGVIVSDSLLMAAVRDAYDTPAKQAAAMLRAGVDLLLDPVEPEAMVAGIVRAVERGHLDAERVDEAFRHVWRLKEHLATRHGGAAFPTTVQAAASSEGEHQRLAADVARQAVRCLGGPTDLLPVEASDVAERGLLAVVLTPHADDTAAPLLTGLRARFPNATTQRFGPDDDAGLAALPDKAAPYGYVLLALAARPAAWQQFGLRPAQQDVVRTLARQRPVIVAALGSPDLLADCPQGALRLCTYSDVPVSQLALVRAMCGEAEIKGA